MLCSVVWIIKMGSWPSCIQNDRSKMHPFYSSWILYTTNRQSTLIRSFYSHWTWNSICQRQQSELSQTLSVSRIHIYFADWQGIKIKWKCLMNEQTRLCWHGNERLRVQRDKWLSNAHWDEKKKRTRCEQFWKLIVKRVIFLLQAIAHSYLSLSLSCFNPLFISFPYFSHHFRKKNMLVFLHYEIDFFKLVNYLNKDTIVSIFLPHFEMYIEIVQLNFYFRIYLYSNIDL